MRQCRTAQRFLPKSIGEVGEDEYCTYYDKPSAGRYEQPIQPIQDPWWAAVKAFICTPLFVRKGSLLDMDNEELKANAETPYGNIVDMAIIKTKVCRPDRRVAAYTLHYTTGIDVLGDTVYMAIKYNFLVQAGAWYTLIDPETGEVLEQDTQPLKFQGKAKLLAFLRDNDEIFDNLYSKVNDAVTVVAD